MIGSGFQGLGQQYGTKKKVIGTPTTFIPFSPVTKPTTAGATIPEATVPFSPEFKGLKHSMYNIPIGTSERERTDIFNVGRGQIQTSTDVAMEQMRELLGSKGFRAGESGIADTLLGGIAKEGQKTLSQFAKEQTIEESRRRFQEALARGNFELLEREFGLKREMFGHGKEMEAIQMLMQMFFGGQQVQQQRYEPYWQALVR